MRSLIDDLSLADDGYHVAVLDGAEAMGDDKTGTTFLGDIKGFLYDLIVGDEKRTEEMKQTFSLSVSRALVASSSRRTDGDLTKALAMAILCF